MKYSIDSFEIDIEECIRLCREELFKRENEISGESTIDQLKKVIQPELRSYYKKSEQGIYHQNQTDI